MRFRNLLCALLVAIGAAQLLHAAPAEKAPAPPADAQWTIQCRTFSGPDRVMESMRTRDFLRKTTGDKTWYLLHGNNETTLFFGYYRSVTIEGAEGKAKDDAKRAFADRKKIVELSDERGQKAFAGAFFVGADVVGEDGPPEWDIAKTAPEFRWSLLIGVYEETPERKRITVDAVKKLRGEKVEAYYYHGETQSFVYVGCWDADSIIRTEIDTSRLSENENEQVMVIDRDLPPGVPTVYRGPDGKTVKLATRTLTIKNQNIKEMQAKFPHFHTNGQVMGKKVKDPKTHEEKLVHDQSVLTSIPRRDKTIVSGDRPSTPPSVHLIRPPGETTKSPGKGRLKSLDEK